MAATFWAFPELQRGWWRARGPREPGPGGGVDHRPAPVPLGRLDAGGGAVACWRRRRYTLATVLAGLGQATHPAVVLPMGLVLVAWWWRWEPDRRRLLRYYAAWLVPAIPAALLVFASPVFGDSDPVVVRDKLLRDARRADPRAGDTNRVGLRATASAVDRSPVISDHALSCCCVHTLSDLEHRVRRDRSKPSTPGARSTGSPTPSC